MAASCVCRCDENPEDCLGVDLNRNFPSGWGLGSTKFMEDSSLPCMEMYKGQTGERTHCKEKGGARAVGDRVRWSVGKGKEVKKIGWGLNQFGGLAKLSRRVTYLNLGFVTAKWLERLPTTK